MSEGGSNPFDNKPVLQAPATPKDTPRSRYDQFSTPTQSPMIKISELEEPDTLGSPSLSDIMMPPNAQFTGNHNKRNSLNFSPGHNSSGSFSQAGNRTSLYSLDNNSSSSFLIPGGNVPGNRSSISSLKYVPPPPVPPRNRSPTRSSSPIRSRSPSPKKYQPFNFRSTNLSTPSSVNNARASHRKGHRYKHSSVSMNFFQEPKARAPLKIAISFPIPTINEFFNSCNQQQKQKLIWSFAHLLTSLIIFLVGFKYSLTSFSTLSHLIFYDSLGSLTVVFVDIMTNFDVWSKSSMKYPFGLGRIEVLAGFALSISLIFVGCDLISHFIEEFMISFFDDNNSTSHDHSSGHNHHHKSSSLDINIFTYEFFIIFAAITTLISSNFIVVKDNINNMIKNFKFLSKTNFINNPTHFITLLFTIYLSLYPVVININSDFKINEISTLFISILICYIGWKIVSYLGSILLLTYPGTKSQFNSISNLISDEIKSLNQFKSNYSIQNFVIFRVHSKLLVVFIHIKMVGGSDDDEISLRYQINEIIKTHIKQTDIETTVDIDRL
ncbi:putative membrane protein [Wickerhamomyces ciferrii]|uniref:Membrane protein n=1 Tax=Wickerhamomyces ciferrii (strain ATCC 14091 / BCRC 22168 / CBS 111 / JCM 3599 / NBRC 0793 / NRRL Y-1031 F-60-10) TaxID=1206466 RepID=K0KNH7_WICCF|nr:uncharacterized protein BN7_6384 [Wickerhamomyces ciferrii]CCH46785.1 putative membrane protein [Wickerhamomyces ciferrii]